MMGSNEASHVESGQSTRRTYRTAVVFERDAGERVADTVDIHTTLVARSGLRCKDPMGQTIQYLLRVRPVELSVLEELAPVIDPRKSQQPVLQLPRSIT